MKNKSIYLPKAVLDCLDDTQLEQVAAKMDLANKQAIITDIGQPGHKQQAFVKQPDGEYKEMDYTDYLLGVGERDISEIV